MLLAHEGDTTLPAGETPNRGPGAGRASFACACAAGLKLFSTSGVDRIGRLGLRGQENRASPGHASSGPLSDKLGDWWCPDRILAGPGSTTGRVAGCCSWPGGSAPTLIRFRLAFTISQAAASALSMSPSFEVTATTMFFSGMNTTSAYHIVFDPLCQYTVYGISSPGSILIQPHA